MELFLARLSGNLHELLLRNASVENHVVLATVDAHEALNTNLVGTCGQVLDGLLNVNGLVIGLDVVEGAAELGDVTAYDSPTGNAVLVAVEGGRASVTILTFVEVGVLDEDGEVVARLNLRGIVEEGGNEFVNLTLSSSEVVLSECTGVEALGEFAFSPVVDVVLKLRPLAIKVLCREHSLVVNFLELLVEVVGVGDI